MTPLPMHIRVKYFFNSHIASFSRVIFKKMNKPENVQILSVSQIFQNFKSSLTILKLGKFIFCYIAKYALIALQEYIFKCRLVKIQMRFHKGVGSIVSCLQSI